MKRYPIPKDTKTLQLFIKLTFKKVNSFLFFYIMHPFYTKTVSLIM